MEIELAHIFRFEAARRLPTLPPDHPCARVHGHSFEVEVVLVGEVNADTGLFIDYVAIEAAWRPLAEQLDHHYLNEVAGLENPTTELIAVWVWRGLAPSLPGLRAVSVMETPQTRATYRGR